MSQQPPPDGNDPRTGSSAAGTGPEYPYGPTEDGEQQGGPQQGRPEYGQPQYGAPQYGGPAYGQGGESQPPYGAQPQSPYPSGYGYQSAGPAMPASTIVLLVVSGLATLSVYFTLAGLPALVLGIVALSRNSTAPQDTRRYTRIGWIVLGVLSLLLVLLAVGALVALFSYTPTF